jgi:hypothetical protein
VAPVVCRIERASQWWALSSPGAWPGVIVTVASLQRRAQFQAAGREKPSPRRALSLSTSGSADGQDLDATRLADGRILLLRERPIRRPSKRSLFAGGPLWMVPDLYRVVRFKRRAKKPPATLTSDATGACCDASAAT